MSSVGFEGNGESCLLILLTKGMFLELGLCSLLVADLLIREMPRTGKVMMCFMYVCICL